jgi:uncharacterized protein YlzI (FlbEa/FlbD family)
MNLGPPALIELHDSDGPIFVDAAHVMVAANVINKQRPETPDWVQTVVLLHNGMKFQVTESPTEIVDLIDDIRTNALLEP